MDIPHHDGIHYYGTDAINTFIISGNLFEGNWGNNNTAHVFLETGPSNVLYFNNVHIQYPGNLLGDGMLVNTGRDTQGNTQVYNNTFIGSSAVPNSTALSLAGQGTVVMNNVFSAFTCFIATWDARQLNLCKQSLCKPDAGREFPLDDSGDRHL